MAKRVVESTEDYEKRTKRRKQLLSERKQLPIWEGRHRIVETLKSRPVMILIGETGTGKTTQVPQFLYDAYKDDPRTSVVCTQPRRIAAISVAQRVNEEISGDRKRLGGLVGYSVRFDRKESQSTRIKFVTDGMLLREAQQDPLLSKYSVVLLDEVHERTVDTDIVLGILRDILEREKSGNFAPGTKKRKNKLRVVLMSATMNPKLFSDFFGPDQCSVQYVAGRQYPIDVYHVGKAEDCEDRNHAVAVAALQLHIPEPRMDTPEHKALVHSALQHPERSNNTSALGSILIFSTGREEIEGICRLLRTANRELESLSEPQFDVIPLYAALSGDEQLKAFDPIPEGKRRVIVATNVAETSITLPNIRFVIDSGQVKVKRFDAANNFDTLRTELITKGQARQRMGRAGREGPGVCIRVYTERDFQKMDEDTTPEILRSSLTGSLLYMASIGIKDVVNFNYISKPDIQSIANALENLVYLGCVNADEGTITPLGKQISRFPLPPYLAKWIIRSAQQGCSEEVCIIISMLSSDNVFYDSSSAQDIEDEEGNSPYARFVSKYGDHLTLLNVWRAYRKAKKDRHWCHANRLNRRSLLFAESVHRQLVELMTTMKLPRTSCQDDLLTLRKSITECYILNSAVRIRPGLYRTLRKHREVHIHPSSSMFGRNAECVVFAEQVSTSKEYVRIVTGVDISWVSKLAPSLLAANV
eukprot:Clim_evm132s157 gene=Clim_evmTU132s157